MSFLEGSITSKLGRDPKNGWSYSVGRDWRIASLCFVIDKPHFLTSEIVFTFQENVTSGMGHYPSYQQSACHL